MKPNVVSYHTDTREDAFSRSLGYVLNTFPEIGQDLVERPAALSGRSPALFGKFLECEFVGQEVLEGHRSSRPDLRIACSNCSVFVEVKLDSPLSLDQADFRNALKAGGMEGRRLKGAQGSLYTFNSDASHLRKFPVTADLEFIEDGTGHQGLERLGFFLISVGLKGRAQNTEIDFESLEGPLKRVLNFWS